MKLSSNHVNNSKFCFLKEKNSDFCCLEHKKRSLALFHKAARNVPAYKNFLKKNNIDQKKIKTWEDFQLVTPTNKKNYLKQFSLEQLGWNGHLKKPLIFTSTSGSTGEPFYFHRSFDLDWQSSLVYESFYLNGKYKKDEPVLVIICFGMGTWIGGLIAYQSFHLMQERGYNISLITPGINKKEIFNSLKKLSPYFKNTILVGYPPFIKDILDEAHSNGINIKKLNLRLIFAAEAFTEKFRDYLAEKASIKNPYLDTMNIYGSADIGTMASETPLSILIRKIAVKKPALFTDIFGVINKTPTLAQFNPLFINFECINGDVVLTGNSEIPLVRYSIGDHGGVYFYNELIDILKKHNIDIKAEAKRAGISDTLRELPFVFVFERNDFSVTLYGLQIYPEIIRETALQSPFNNFLSGKFIMMTKFDKKQNQYLEINFELKENINSVPASAKKSLLKKVVYNLRHKSSEFRELSDHLKNKANPKLVFWPHESTEFFRQGVKQKWVKK